MKIISKIRSGNAIFLLSNIIFSGSTYLIMLVVPYLLNINTMGIFSSIYNYIYIVVVILELGISINFLRFNQIYNSSIVINAFLNISVFLFILTSIYFSSLNYLINKYINLDGINIQIFIFAVISQLSWMFLKNRLLSLKRIKSILFFSFSILIIRILSLIFLIQRETIIIENIILMCFILPFIFVIICHLYDSFIILIKNLKIVIEHKNSKRLLEIFKKRLFTFIKYSIIVYIIVIIYTIASRYLIIYLSEVENNQFLAELGYSMTFLGIVTLMSSSIRTYLVSKFKLTDTDNIYNHIQSIKKYTIYFVPAALIFSLLISFIVYTIKPNYLSTNSVIFSFIITLSYSLIFYISLITFLARTMNYNKLEGLINIFRLIGIIIIVNLFFLKYPILTFVGINIIMVLGELYFAKVIVKRLINE